MLLRFWNNVVKGLFGNEIYRGKRRVMSGYLGKRKFEEGKNTEIKFRKRGKHYQFTRSILLIH